MFKCFKDKNRSGIQIPFLIHIINGKIRIRINLAKRIYLYRTKQTQYKITTGPDIRPLIVQKSTSISGFSQQPPALKIFGDRPKTRAGYPASGDKFLNLVCIFNLLI